MQSTTIQYSTAFVVDETFVGDFAVNVDEAAVQLPVSEIVLRHRSELFINRLLGFQRAIHLAVAVDEDHVVAGGPGEVRRRSPPTLV